MISLCYLAVSWVLALATLHARPNDFNELEIVVLRHELAIFRRARRQPQPIWTDRPFLAAASRLLPRTRWSSSIVTPKTLLAWHRRLVDLIRTPFRPPQANAVAERFVRNGSPRNASTGYRS